jgi:hypothetical protein
MTMRRASRTSAQHLDLLLLGGAQPAHARARVVPEVDALGELREALALGAPVQQPARAELDAEEDVVEHR